MAIRDYWLMQRCYAPLRQGGPDRLIDASLEHPVKVQWEDTVMRGGVPEQRKTDRFLVLIEDGKPEPEKPADVRPGLVGAPEMNLARPVDGEEHRGRRGKRAADV